MVEYINVVKPLLHV